MQPPTLVKQVRSFLGHAGFYRRFIKDFSLITKPLTSLLLKDVDFVFDDPCLKTFCRLKEALVTAPIIQPPDWNLPFEIMCDASDYRDEVLLHCFISPSHLNGFFIEPLNVVPQRFAFALVYGFEGCHCFRLGLRSGEEGGKLVVEIAP